MTKLFIITASYPFGSGETFLHNEILILSQHFDIKIFPIYRKNKSDQIRKIVYLCHYFVEKLFFQHPYIVVQQGRMEVHKYPLTFSFLLVQLFNPVCLANYKI